MPSADDELVLTTAWKVVIFFNVFLHNTLLLSSRPNTIMLKVHVLYWAIPDRLCPPPIEDGCQCFVLKTSGTPQAILQFFLEIQTVSLKKPAFLLLVWIFFCGNPSEKKKGFVEKGYGNPVLYFIKKVWKSNLL